MDEKPYITYLLEANVGDKGVGYAIKTNLTNFFASHGIKGRIEDFKPNSNTVSMIIKVYAGESPDLTMKAMYTALANKGRMSRKESCKPDIKISPVAPEWEPVEPGCTSDAAWQKVVEDLNGKIYGLMKKEEGLSAKLSEAQSQVRQYEGIIAKLKYEQQNMIPREYNDAIEALVQTFVPTGIPLMKEISLDLLLLSENQDVDMILWTGHGSTLADYVSVKMWPEPEGAEPEDDLELEEYYRKHPIPASKIITEDELRNLASGFGCESWDLSPAGKKLLEGKRKYEADQRVLEFAKSSGASEGVIAAAEIAVNQTNSAELESMIESYKLDFAEKKQLLEKLPVLERGYDILRDVEGNIERRSEQGLTLPVVYYRRHDEVGVFLPEADPVFIQFLQEKTGMQLESHMGHRYLSIKFADIESRPVQRKIKTPEGKDGILFDSETEYYEPGTRNAISEKKQHFPKLVINSLIKSMGVTLNIVNIDELKI